MSSPVETLSITMEEKKADDERFDLKRNSGDSRSSTRRRRSSAFGRRYSGPSSLSDISETSLLTDGSSLAPTVPKKNEEWEETEAPSELPRMGVKRGSSLRESLLNNRQASMSLLEIANLTKEIDLNKKTNTSDPEVWPNASMGVLETTDHIKNNTQQTLVKKRSSLDLTDLSCGEMDTQECPTAYGNASVAVLSAPNHKIMQKREMIARGIGSEASMRRILGVKGKQEKVAAGKNIKLDLLEEGQNYLAKSMLVYIYAQLREMATLGYTTAEHREIDVNTFKRYPPPEEDEEDKKKVDDGVDRYLDNTRTAGAIIRTVLEELDAEQREDRESLNHNGNDISIIGEFTKWVNDSKVTKPDDAADVAIKEIKRKVARARWKRAISMARVSAKLKLMGLGKRPDANEDDSKKKEEKKEVIKDEPKETKEEPVVVKDDKTGIGWFRVQRRMIEKQFGVTDKPGERRKSLEPNSKQKGNTKPNQTMIDEALEKVMHNYFKSGSVLRRMMEQGMEVVYFGDRHPNEAIYCICVNRETKTVTVIFRGSVTAHNWLYNMKLMMSEQKNPLASEGYDGCDDLFGLHTGFGLYMLKKRKDNGQSKIDEIFEKVDAIGRELHSGGRYRVAVTGHSLGGALSTILSFYAACDRRFTTVAPVRTFTFAAPRVGDQRFLDAYKQLERTDRLMHARFTNTCDFVPLTPTFAVNGTKFGPFYQHVGLQVKLHETNLWGKTRLRFALDASYPLSCSFAWKVRRACSNNFITNLTTLKKFGKNHGLSEYQRRIHFARQIRFGLGQTEFRNDARRKDLKTLEEYYRIRAHIPAPPRPVLEEENSISRRTVTGVMVEDFCATSSKRRIAAVSTFLFIMLVMSCAAVYVRFSPEGEKMFESFMERLENKAEYYRNEARKLVEFSGTTVDEVDVAKNVLDSSEFGVVITEHDIFASDQSDDNVGTDLNDHVAEPLVESNLEDLTDDAVIKGKVSEESIVIAEDVQDDRSMDDKETGNGAQGVGEGHASGDSSTEMDYKIEIDDMESHEAPSIIISEDIDRSEASAALHESNGTLLSLLQAEHIDIPSLTEHICEGLMKGSESVEEGSESQQGSEEKLSWGLVRLENKEYNEMTKSVAGQRARRMTQEVEWKARYFAKTRLKSPIDVNIDIEDVYTEEAVDKVFKNEPGTVLGPLALHFLRRIIPSDQ